MPLGTHMTGRIHDAGGNGKNFWVPRWEPHGSSGEWPDVHICRTFEGQLGVEKHADLQIEVGKGNQLMVSILVSICKCTNASRWKHSTVHTFCLTWPAAWIAWQEVAKRWGWAAVQVIPLKPWKKWMAKVAQLRRAQHVCWFFSGLGIECIYLVYSVGSESSFKESWHWMFRAWSKSDRVLSTWLVPLVQGVGVHRFILGPFQWRQHQLGSISRSYIHGDLENSWMTCTEDWKPLSLEITFPKVPAKVLGWSTRSRCQGLFMKVMKVSWKSFQSKYFWRTYWVLMVLFRFVWFF